MNVRLLPLLILTILVFVRYCEAACTGNSLGQCNEETPTNCVIERAIIGTSITETQDIQLGRTSYSRYPVPFVHDGATPDFLSSTFAVTALPSSPTDAGSSINEVDCEGSVTVFFNTSEQKTVRVRVFQDVFNRTATSSNAMIITFDQLAPTIQPQQVFESEQPNNNPIAYSAGRTYYTSTDVFVTGRIVDPAPSVSSDQLAVQVVGGLAQSGAILAETGEAPGLFAVPLGIAEEQIDGEYLVELAAWDTANADATFNDGSPANRSEVVVYKVVKDTASPVMTRLEIIRNANSPEQTIEEAPGVFVKRETVLVKASFSEDLKTPPTLSIIQKGSGVGTPPDPYFAIFDPDLFQASKDEVTYSITPQAGLKDIGQIDFLFEGGLDLAGNALSVTEGVLGNGGELARALILDTTPPDLNRIQNNAVGIIQSDPANGEKIPEGNFPREITVIVKDYDLPDNLAENSGGDTFARGNSSGVDFSRIFDSGAEINDDVIRVVLLDPEGQELAGTLATKPPNGLIYILPHEDELFSDRALRRAPQGNYTLQVILVDRVGNVSNEAFSFEVDNTNVSASSVQVTISPAPAIDDDFQVDTGNPLLDRPITGELIPDSPFLKDLENLDSIRELSSVEICSNDASMNLSRSQIFLKARLNGPDTVARTMNTTITVDADSSNGVCSANGLITLIPGDQSQVFPAIDFGFPNPSAIGAGVIEGSRDPRFGLYDGPYSMEVIARDDAGNLSEPIIKEFLLDTTPPFTRQVFPAENSKINAPLQHFSAILEDPHPPKLHVLDEDSHINFGSGISVQYSGMSAQLVTPYRPEDLDATLFDLNNSNQIKARLNYVHRPNSFDASLPTFSPEDDYYRVLLEFIDEQGNTRTLPLDGSADGIYSMTVLPVDNAGNSIDGALAGQSGWKPITNPDQIQPQELKRSFFFLLDTIAPNLKIDLPENQNLGSKIIVSGGAFNLSGTAKDLSAQRDLPGSGGAGMSQIDWELVFLNPDGSLALPDSSGDESTVKKNPITTGLAILSAIENESSDPTLDSSRPLKSDTYGGIVLEERTWRIDGELPPFSQIITATDVSNGSLAKYFLRVYARDLAGNDSMQSIEMVINQGDLYAPDLVKPFIREYISSTAVNFEWKAVQNAADYVLYISQPTGSLTTYPISPQAGVNENVETLQILNANGDYQWWVRARDSIGNQGSESLRQSFTIDTLAPQVNLVTWMDISPDTIPTITRGQFVIRITFDGALKDGPQVHFQPFLSSIPKQLVETYNLTDNVWEGRAQIPQSADNSWDGQAILHIENATDLANNTMIMDRTHAFEIETGPTFSVRFFENPVANNELTLIIKSTEVLSGDPVISTPNNIQVIQERPLKIEPQVYSTGLRMLDHAQSGIGEITIVGQDLLGNTATRIVTFAMNSIDGLGGGSIFNSKLRVDVQPGSFQGRRNVALLPPPEADTNRRVNGLSASLSKGGWSQELGSVYPANLNSVNPVQVAVKFNAPLNSKTGLFLSSVQGLEFLTDVSSVSAGEWRTVELSTLGSLHLVRDLTGPSITIPYDLSEELFSGRQFSMQLFVEDELSGLDQKSIKAELDNNKLITTVDSDGNVSLESRYFLSEGDQELILEASDLLGNKIIHKTMIMVAGPLRMEFSSYPNPASQFATLEYRLTQAVKGVRLKIYDISSRLIYSNNSHNSIDLPTQGGTHQFDWLLNNQQGVSVSNGVYVAQLLIQDQSGVSHKLRCKIAVVR